MDSATQALQKLSTSQPQLFRKLAGDAKVLMRDSPPFRRLIKNIAVLVGKDELSFTATAGSTQIDTHLAALREGAKIPLHLIDQLAAAGTQHQADNE